MSQNSVLVSNPNSFQWHFRSLFHPCGLSTSHSSHHYSDVKRKMSSDSFSATWKRSKVLQELDTLSEVEFVSNVAKALWMMIVLAPNEFCITFAKRASENFRSYEPKLMAGLWSRGEVSQEINTLWELLPSSGPEFSERLRSPDSRSCQTHSYSYCFVVEIWKKDIHIARASLTPVFNKCRHGDDPLKNRARAINM